MVSFVTEYFLAKNPVDLVKLSPDCFQSELVFKTVRETNPEYRSSLYNVLLQTLQQLHIAGAMLLCKRLGFA